MKARCPNVLQPACRTPRGPLCWTQRNTSGNVGFHRMYLTSKWKWPRQPSSSPLPTAENAEQARREVQERLARLARLGPPSAQPVVPATPSPAPASPDPVFGQPHFM